MLAQPAAISRPVHALLLLANGQRSEQELSLLLGADVSSLAHGLLVEGYLQLAAPQVLDDETEGESDLWPANSNPARSRPVLRASA